MGGFLGQLIDGRAQWLNWKSAVAGTVWCGLNFAALVVLLRWMAGAVSAAPPTEVVCAVGLLLAASGVAADALFHRLDFRGDHWSWGAAPAFLTLFPLLVTIIVIPSEAAAAAWFVGTLVGLSSIVLFLLETTFRHRQLVEREETAAEPNTASVSERTIEEKQIDEVLDSETTEIDADLERRLAGSFVCADDEESAEVPWHSPGVSQWMTRSDAPDGTVSLEGVAVAEFSAGQTRTYVHLAFCPALPAVPHVECEPVDGGDVRVKIAAVYPHGVRIELTRSARATDEAEVPLGYFAHVARKKTNEAAA